MESEREFAFFENKQSGLNALFKGGKMREYLPKFSGIEYFFTGMLVKNLLWNKRMVGENKKTAYDFEIEY